MSIGNRALSDGYLDRGLGVQRTMLPNGISMPIGSVSAAQ
jgi:hypothetical protein